MLNFIKNIGPVEWVVILLVLIIIFGRKILVSLGRASGETVRELKSVKKSLTDAVEGTEDKPEKKEVS